MIAFTMSPSRATDECMHALEYRYTNYCVPPDIAVGQIWNATTDGELQLVAKAGKICLSNKGFPAGSSSNLTLEACGVPGSTEGVWTIPKPALADTNPEWGKWQLSIGVTSCVDVIGTCSFSRFQK